MGELWTHTMLQAKYSARAMWKMSPLLVLLFILVVPATVPVIITALQRTGNLNLGPIEQDAISYPPISLQVGAQETLATWRRDPSLLGFVTSETLRRAICESLGVDTSLSRQYDSLEQAAELAPKQKTQAVVVIQGNANLTILSPPPPASINIDGSVYETLLGRNSPSVTEYAITKGLALLQAIASKAMIASNISIDDEISFQRTPDTAFVLPNPTGSILYGVGFFAVLAQTSVLTFASTQIRRKERRQLLCHGQRTEAFVLGWFFVALLRGLSASIICVVTCYTTGVLTTSSSPLLLLLSTFILYAFAQAAWVSLIIAVSGRFASIVGQLLLPVTLVAFVLLQLLVVDPQSIGLSWEPAPAGAIICTFLLHNNAFGATLWAAGAAQGAPDRMLEKIGPLPASIGPIMLLVDGLLYITLAVLVDRRRITGTFSGTLAWKGDVPQGAKDMAIHIRGLSRYFAVPKERVLQEESIEEDPAFRNAELARRRLSLGEFLAMGLGFPPKYPVLPLEALDENRYAKKAWIKEYKARKKVEKKQREASLEKVGCFRHKIRLRAVDNLNLDVEPNQVFCLLGQNGAGKTTAMDMLIGALRPTKGDIWVRGNPISKRPHLMRRNVGLCPQHDVYMSHTTCLSQLTVYGMFHGLSKTQAEEEALALLERFGIGDKANSYPETLSGGQLRRLSVAGAVIGRPPLLFLDECTTGLDPANRRRIWDLIRELKEDHTIILTTHSMEEAEALGDRIAIMAKGNLQAIGTLDQLRQEYGPWYNLSCLRKSRISVKGEAESLLSFVRTHVSGAELLRSFGPKVSLSLPTAQVGNFPALFDALQANKDTLGVTSFGVSPSTLDDIFMQLADQQEDGNDEDTTATIKDDEGGVENPGTLDVLGDVEAAGTLGTPPPRIDLQTSKLRQLGALFHVLVLGIVRRPSTLVALLVTPLFYAIIGGALQLIPTGTNASSKGVLSIQPLETYPSAYWLYSAPAMLLDTFQMLFEPFGGLPLAPDRALFEELATNPGTFAGLEVSNTSMNIIYRQFNWAGPEPARVTLANVFRGLANLSGVSDFQVQLAAWQEPLAFNNPVVIQGLHLPALGIAVSTGAIAVELARLQKSRFDQILLLSGMDQKMFWCSNTAIYTIFVFVGQALTIGIMAAFGMEAFTHADSIVLFTILLAVCAPATVLQGLVFAQGVKNPEKAEGVINFILIAGFLLFWALYSYAFTPEQPVFSNLATVLLPSFGVFRCYAVLQAYALNGTPLSMEQGFQWQAGYSSILVSMLSSLVLYSGLLAIIMIRRAAPSWTRASSPSSSSVGVAEQVSNPLALWPNDDVHKALLEQNVQEVASGQLPTPVCALPPRDQVATPEDIGLLCYKVDKSFGSFRAVTDATLVTTKGSIHGLLGPNGAGKSTLANMVSRFAQYGPDSGEILVDGVSSVTHLSEARKRLGVCPQFDAHLEMLTGREMLTAICKVRGVPKNKLDGVVNYYLKALGLKPKADAQCGTYSGGNRRRLSIGMAMVAGPKVVLLDEPTTGIDPATRRSIWDFLLAATQATGCSILLTTHSMEEADVLCDRLAIMVQGSIRAAGETSELKQRYGGGAILSLTMSPTCERPRDRANNLAKQISHRASLDRYQVGRTYRFTLPSQDVNFAEVFRVLSKTCAEPNGLQTFSIAQHSLDDVFIKLASLQK